MSKVTVIEKGNKYKVVVNSNSVNFHKNDSIYVAGENLGGHRVVYVENGKVYYADKDNFEHINKPLYITITAAGINDAVTLRSFGELADQSFNFTPNKSVYLGNAGFMTQALPVTGFQLELAKVISTNKIFINIKSEIIIGE